MMHLEAIVARNAEPVAAPTPEETGAYRSLAFDRRISRYNESKGPMDHDVYVRPADTDSSHYNAMASVVSEAIAEEAR
jgi:hypothetical protein